MIIIVLYDSIYSILIAAMAEIKPFRAWRYAPDYQSQIATLMSPLFDVISEKQRKALYRNPLNSIHLSVPLGEKPAQTARITLEEWKKNGVLVQDEKLAIYVYYQYFNLNNSKKVYCRKGFISFIKAYDWNENVVLRHEQTIPHAVNDRIELLEQTLIQASPTHGLYSDASFTLEALMDKAMQNPIYDEEDYQGVRNVLAAITDTEEISVFVKMIEKQAIILADGHHRYESSMFYRQKMKNQNPLHQDNELYNYHMMYLTNADADDLRILPTHRLMVGLPDINEEELLQKVSEFFTIKVIEESSDVEDVIAGKKWTFGLIVGENSYKIKLKSEVHSSIYWSFSPEVLELDLTVLHFFFIEKVLGIKGVEQRKSTNIIFERNFAECIAKVMSKKVQIALIVNEVSMEEIRKVCYSGYTMPQKSTYFYPKTVCGFTFGSISESDK